MYACFVCLCANVCLRLCMRNLISAHGCRPLSVSVYVRSPKPNKLPSMDDYRLVSDVTYTPWGLRSCGPSHHCGVWSACLTVIVPNIRSRLQDLNYAALNMTWHYTRSLSTVQLSGQSCCSDIHWAPLDATTVCFHWGGPISGLVHCSDCLQYRLHMRVNVIICEYVMLNEKSMCLHFLQTRRNWTPCIYILPLQQKKTTY